MTETVFTNAQVALADEVIDGTVVVRDGEIAEVAAGRSAIPSAIDLGGDILMPGMVELHTDNLEKHLTPRPKTDWPATAALVAHDSQLTAAGITTVFDSISVGAVVAKSDRLTKLQSIVEAIETGVANNLLRAEHHLHLRCEVAYAELPQLLEPLIAHPLVGLVSIMDHTPGQRQFVSEEAYRTYYQGKYGLTDDQMETFIRDRKADQRAYGEAHRRYAVERARALGHSLASHDDATPEHVAEALADGMSFAEFPTTVEAAQAAHAAGLAVMMGAPNLVRGRSHSGNVSARDLAALDALDIVSSDYIPNALLHAAFLLDDTLPNFNLPKAVRTVTKAPADAAGMHDRGEIAAGKRADLIRVHRSPHHPLIRGVWRGGERIA